MPVTSNCRGNQGNIIQNTELRMPWSPNTIDIMHVKSFIVCLTLVKNHPQYHHTWVVKTIPKLDRGFPFGLHYRAFTVHAPFFSFPLPPCSLCFPSRFLSLRQSCVGWPFMFRSFPFLSCSFPSFQIGKIHVSTLKVQTKNCHIPCSSFTIQFHQASVSFLHFSSQMFTKHRYSILKIFLVVLSFVVIFAETCCKKKQPHFCRVKWEKRWVILCFRVSMIITGKYIMVNKRFLHHTTWVCSEFPS